MAKPKFPLRMDDGSEVRTLEELREHADLATIAARYDDGTLRRWLGCWNFIEEAAKVEELDSEDEGFHKALYDVLGIPWTEETDAQLAAYAHAEIERELAAQREQEEQKAHEEAEVEEASEETTDEIAQSIMNMTGTFKFLRLPDAKDTTFVESQHFILCASNLAGPWYRIDKRTGQEQELKLQHSFYDCSKFGDMLYAMDNRALVSLNLETLEEEVLMEGVCPLHISTQHFYFAPMASSKMVAYEKSGEVCLFDCEAKEEISVIQGGSAEYTQNFASSARMKAKMALTEDSLYFLYGGHSANNVIGGLYRYDICTQKCSVLLSQEDIERIWGDYQETNAISAIIVKDDALLITNISGAWYKKNGCNYPSSHNPYWAKLILSKDETTVRVEKTQEIKCDAYCQITYEDGFLYITQRDNCALYISFVNKAGEGKSFPLRKLNNEAESEELTKHIYKAGLRLGKYFFFPVYEDGDKREEIWKISLETGEQVKLSCGN